MLAGCSGGETPAVGGETSAIGGETPAVSNAAASPPQPDAPLELPPKSAEAFRGAEAKTPAAYLAEPRYAEADAHRGELLAYACKACHALVPNEENDLGPSLAGVIGRSAAALPGFEYSDVLASSGIVWTPEAIERWLADPEAFLPGTKMKFPGYKSATDRRDVVAYLLRLAAAEPGVR
jgi:cytochrome c2